MVELVPLMVVRGQRRSGGIRGHVAPSRRPQAQGTEEGVGERGWCVCVGWGRLVWDDDGGGDGDDGGS